MRERFKRELKTRIDALESRHEANTDVALIILPDESYADDDLPDVSTDGIRALDGETGRREVIVPHHRPDEWWRDGLPMVAESHVAAVWRNMDAEQLAREREIREEHDHPIPPILEDAT